MYEMKKLGASTVFTFFIVLAMIWAVIGAKDFPLMARLYPWFVGSIGLVISLLLLVKELKGIGRKKAVESGTGGMAVDLESDSSMPRSVRTRKALRAFAWFLALYLAIWLLGFKVGVVAFLIAYISIEARARWLLVLGLTVGLGFVLFCFDKLLKVYWLEGLLTDWLGESLPWLF